MTLIKSDAVSSPANVEVCEFHRGAETISILEKLVSLCVCWGGAGGCTILY